ncbi:MAG: flagellar hook-length control protein FliK [Planctomycetota bacterium]
MDVVEGRSSGTGRPSLPTAGDASTPDGAPSRFAGWLERGLAAGASFGDKLERRVETQVASRIRTVEQRAERGGDAAERRESASAGADRAERKEAPGRKPQADRSEGERASERSADRDDPTATPDPTSAGAAEPPRREDTPRALEGRARSLAATDAADAHGANGPSGAQSGSSSAAFDGLDAGASAAPAPAASAAQRASAAAPVFVAAPVVGAAAGQPVANEVAPGTSTARAADARAATATDQAAAPHGPTTEDIELAESVMRQLRARIQMGAREAIIELRPSELGRIDVRLKMEDGVLSATIRAERPETLAVLEAHGPELRAYLAQNGTEVRELDLGLAEPGASFQRHAGQERGSQKQDSERGQVRGARARSTAQVDATAQGRGSSAAGTTTHREHDAPRVDIVI